MVTMTIYGYKIYGLGETLMKTFESHHLYLTAISYFMLKCEIALKIKIPAQEI